MAIETKRVSDEGHILLYTKDATGMNWRYEIELDGDEARLIDAVKYSFPNNVKKTEKAERLRWTRAVKRELKEMGYQPVEIGGSDGD